jgi:predicted site-specific integrase-resolvase
MAPARASSPLVDERKAAEILGIAAGTLTVWRSTGRYKLPYTKIGRAVRYRVDDLEAFIQSRMIGRAAG